MSEFCLVRRRGMNFVGVSIGLLLAIGIACMLTAPRICRRAPGGAESRTAAAGDHRHRRLVRRFRQSADRWREAAIILDRLLRRPRSGGR